MGRARRGRLVAVLAAGGACVLGLVVALGGNRSAAAELLGVGSSAAPVPGQSGAVPSTSPGTFRISGSIGGLYPGDTAQLVLTVTNPQHFPIDVTSISTTVSSPGTGCSFSYMSVAPFSGNLTVPASGSAIVSVPVTLSHAAPDACQGATFPLRYTGLAQKG